MDDDDEQATMNGRYAEYGVITISSLTLERYRNLAFRLTAEVRRELKRNEPRRITMRLSSARRNLWLGISLLLLAAPALAQSTAQKTSAQKNPAHKQEPLAENENPELIGKRNIN